MKENLSKERLEQINAIYSGWFKKLQSKEKPCDELLSILIRSSGRCFGIYEEWKDAPDYEGLYEVSNFGRIKSSYCRKSNLPQVLKPHIDSSGYLSITLCRNKIHKTTRIHILVAIAFLNHTPNGRTLVVNHRDFNRKNNMKYNIEIVTMRENTNQKHMKSTSKYVGVSRGKNDKKWNAYIYVNKRNIYLGRFENELDAANAYQNAFDELTNGH